ncbi:MAG: hydroxymethylbilane synthase [Candidatus Latescibacterota bacterium]
MSQDRLIIGTRGSALALAQARAVAALLRSHHPDLQVQIEVIRTQGDVTSGSLRTFGGQGVFTREIENALLDGRADLAVHSLKDLPTATHADLRLVAVPEREDVRDVLVAAGPTTVGALPRGARVGTGSLRRQAQLLALRPDLRIQDIRGNLDTRMGKVAQGACAAVILAAAGLRRLGWEERISAYLEPEVMLPAVGQAALGLQMRADSPLAQRVEVLSHAPSLHAVTAERSLLAALGGGCHAPIAAWSRVEDGRLRLDGLVARPDGSLLVRGQVAGAAEEAVALGARLAAELRERGAHAILSAARG